MEVFYNLCTRNNCNGCHILFPCCFKERGFIYSFFLFTNRGCCLVGEREKLILDMKDALSKIKTLSGLLPICSSCKKIRNDDGYWEQVEVYVRDRSNADFSHSLCPDCVKKLYPGLTLME